VGVRLVVLFAAPESNIGTAFTTLVQQRAAALLVYGDALFTTRLNELVALTTRVGGDDGRVMRPVGSLNAPRPSCARRASASDTMSESAGIGACSVTHCTTGSVASTSPSGASNTSSSYACTESDLKAGAMLLADCGNDAD
jgi:hypothetical protein